jgi:hypothetical protein
VQTANGVGKGRAMSDTAEAGTRIADHNLVATYESSDEARAALTMLERHGVESGDIELFGPGMAAAREPITNDEQRKVDLDTSGAVGRRVLKFVPVLALVLGVIGAVAGAQIGGKAVHTITGAVCGVVVGAALGLFYGGYTKLPVNEEWGETFETTRGVVSVAVHSEDRSEIETALEALKGTAAKRLATCGRDGQLQDVA